MEIKYKLKESDFLNNQLFVASNSERINKTRRRSVYGVPLFYVILACFLFFSSSNEVGVSILILAVLWAMFYPKFQARKYLKHYKSHIKENYTHKFNTLISLEISEEYLKSKDSISEGKIKLSEVKSISRLPENYLITIGVGENVVLPRYDINNNEMLVTDFVGRVAEVTGLKIIDKLEWKWK